MKTIVPPSVGGSIYFPWTMPAVLDHLSTVQTFELSLQLFTRQGQESFFLFRFQSLGKEVSQFLLRDLA